MSQAIMYAAIETVKAVMRLVREAESLTDNATPIQTVQIKGSPSLKQLTIDWKGSGKYHELCNFEIE